MGQSQPQKVRDLLPGGQAHRSMPGRIGTKESQSGTAQSDCPICAGFGWVRVDAALGDLDFGQALRCRCVSGADQARAAELLKAATRLPANLSGRTFANFLPGWSGRKKEPPAGGIVDRRQKALDAVLAWVEHGGWLTLQGSYGTGKTHLAAAATNALVAAGKPAIFALVPDLLDGLRDQIRQDAFLETFDALKQTPGLILDDLGIQHATSWAEEKLCQLYDHRANWSLATLTTTNASIGELPPRIVARMQRMGGWVRLHGP